MYALIHLVAMWELQNDHYTNLGANRGGRTRAGLEAVAHGDGEACAESRPCPRRKMAPLTCGACLRSWHGSMVG